MPPTEQTVFRLTAFDGFDSLQPFREPIPKPSAGEVLVKVRGVALNYRDVAIATSAYLAPVKDNVIPCCDMAGEVVAVGPATESFNPPALAVGDAVIAPVAPSFLYGARNRRPDALDFAWSAGKGDGVLREYIAAAAHSLVKLPPCETARDFLRWAATPCTVSMVWNAFYGNTPLKPGDTVLVLGTGGVSITALVLAKAAGATTIVTSSSDEKLEFVRTRLGADHVINYKTTPDWAAEVQRMTGGEGVDHVIEVGGLGTMQQSLAAVARGGLITVIGFLTGGPQGQVPDVTMAALGRALTIRGVTGGSKQQLEEAIRFMSARGLELPVDKVFAFERGEVIAALKHIESGAHIGKVCVKVG
ncbi:putative NADP-binding protein [Rosellinia necatrix]|uniref:Putative NADP-binding protein n=1 Tax=Rosellinia necatrix TaxID=77044 RepID=A0A1S7UKM4_ROSNE|nr:putative NADP-binding protein [Rosellinia necatrix]